MSAALTGCDSGLWILGDFFLRQSYSIWDMDIGRIGFADLALPSAE
jgi:Eukaryotic aspartyl protease